MSNSLICIVAKPEAKLKGFAKKLVIVT